MVGVFDAIKRGFGIATKSLGLVLILIVFWSIKIKALPKSFENEYLEYLQLKHKDVLNNLRDGILNSDITSVLEKVASELVTKYRAQ